MSLDYKSIQEQQKNIHLSDESEQPNPDKIWEDVIGLIECRENWDNKTEFINYDKQKFVNEMKDKFDELYFKTPTIFEKCCNGDFDDESEIEKLEYMLEMTRQLRLNSSKENYDNITKKVGEKIANEYVNPVLDKINSDKKITEINE